MKKICIMSPLDDINDDGSAVVWWFRDGAHLNISYNCSCIYEMLTARQLFSVFILDEEVEVGEDVFNSFCTERDE